MDKVEVKLRKDAIKDIQKGYAKKMGKKEWRPYPRQQGRSGRKG